MDPLDHLTASEEASLDYSPLGRGPESVDPDEQYKLRIGQKLNIALDEFELRIGSRLLIAKLQSRINRIQGRSPLAALSLPDVVSP